MKWTEDQKKAIYARPNQIVVSAAAGSGKTQVLSTRIAERVKDDKNPVSVDKFLIVTFTKAAAAQMRERIGKTLREEIKNEQNPSRRKFLSRQMALLSGAQICTIDSFCYSVVKQFFYELDLPSDIALGESGEMTLLRLEALEDTVNAFYCALEKHKGTVLNEENLENAKICEEYFENDDLKLILDGFDMLTQSYSSDKSDSDFYGGAVGDYTTMISQIHNKAQSAPFPEKWLDEIALSYSPQTKYTDTLFYKYTMSEAKETLKSVKNTLVDAAELSQNNNIGYEASLQDDINILSSISENSDYEEIRKVVQNEDLFSSLRGKKRNCDASISAQIKAVRNNMKSLIEKDISPLFEMSLEECEKTKNEQYPQIKALCACAELLDKIYFDKMLSRRLIDFSTCEHLALNIITKDGESLSEAGKAILQKYDEVYIDETQDSNAMQDLLFTLISGGRCFMVGDVKQSIYGFRNADSDIFVKKCDESSVEEESEKRKIFLSKNFRSRKCIIDAVNSIFDVVMTEEICAIDYKKEHRLEFGAEFIPASPEDKNCAIYAVEKSGNSQEQTYNEAELTAKKITELINSKAPVWDKETGEMRPVRYSDITVLMRSPSKSTAIYEEVFLKNSVPCYFDGGSSLYDTGEIGRIVEILRLIDNSQCDIPLASTLRSPMFIFDENDLLSIKLSGSESFCDAFYGICSGKYQVEEKLYNKCISFKRTLDRWRMASGFISLSELLRRIYNETDIYTTALSMPNGEMRRANLDLLLEEAELFEKSSYSGLFNFINYVEKMKRTSGGVPEAKFMSEKMNVVRIMSIHKSKGLEFPVVFITACDKKIHLNTTEAGGLLLDSKALCAMNVVNPKLRCRYPSPMRSVLKLMQKNQETAEEMRLFYVALTRAMEKVYVVGTVKNYDAYFEKSLDAMPCTSKAVIMTCGSYLDMIALSYGHGADEKWNFECCETDTQESDDREEEKHNLEFTENKDISKMLDYKYPFENAVNIPNKASVTRLKTIDVNLSGEDIIPINSVSSKNIALKKAEITKKATGGAFYGTAHHKMLQNLDFSLSVSEQKKRLLDKGILTKDEYDVISDAKIQNFIDSELGIDMKNAVKIYREEPFVISEDASVLAPEYAGENICVQGIIDCYYIRKDESIVLVDYKSDVYENPEEIVKKYQKQIFYYEKALKLKFKDKLIQKFLYLLYNNDIIEL